MILSPPVPPRRWAVLFLLGLLSPAASRAAPALPPPVPDLSVSHDYLYPTEAQRLAARVQALPGAAAGWGELVTYTDFTGKPHTLHRFAGRSVAILLPDTWLAAGALDAEQVRTFVDRSDLVYQELNELVGGEPAGSGPLVAAIVPPENTCGWGCGMIGNKGVEIADYPQFNPILWQDIKADKGMTVLVHEMTHNFDLYWPYLAYGPVDAHAWTDFANLYYFLYSREGRYGETPEETARSWMGTTAPYFADPEATWESCVKEAGCTGRGITPNNAWGGMTFRTALLAGPSAARGFLAAVRAWAAKNPPPETAEAKEELHLEALSAGAGLDLSCFADVWHWPASAALRARLAARYPGPNPFCADADGDGVSPVEGDCDDHNPWIHPGATEILNGRDDDCNGMVDDLAIREPAGGDFPARQAVPLPAVIQGAIADTADSDTFTFQLAAAGRLHLDLCSRPDYQGWLFLYNESGSRLGYQYVGRGNCTPGVYSLAAGSYWMEVAQSAESAPGAYTLAAYLAEPAVPVWAATAPPEFSGGVYELLAGSAPTPADQVRFWVLGQGPVGAVPYSPIAGLRWTPPAGFENGPRFYRAQPLKGGVPVADWTPLQAFPALPPCVPGPTVLCLNAGRFRVEAAWKTGTGWTGAGQAVPLTPDTGVFWFFAPGNVELVVKVLDGCAMNRRYWVFAAGLTDVQVTLTVTDSQTGKSQTYTNPQKTAFVPIQDTGSMAVCDGGW